MRVQLRTLVSSFNVLSIDGGNVVLEGSVTTTLEEGTDDDDAPYCDRDRREAAVELSKAS